MSKKIQIIRTRIKNVFDLSMGSQLNKISIRWLRERLEKTLHSFILAYHFIIEEGHNDNFLEIQILHVINQNNPKNQAQDTPTQTNNKYYIKFLIKLAILLKYPPQDFLIVLIR